MEAYFDNSATTIVTEDVKDIVVKVMTEDYGNPSSMHMVGVNAEKYLKEAKETISKILKVEPNEIYFTSGGTESNNWAIMGAVEANKRSGKKIITTKVEHASVKSPMKHLEQLGYEVTYLPVDQAGVVQLDALKEAMTEDTILVSIMYVNNEVGAIQPIEEIGKYIKTINKNVIYHVDAIQAFGKMEIKPKKSNIDVLTVSGHKIHGPKGTGFMYLKKNAKVNPFILGGGQQNAMRSGTENVPGIAGLAKASDDCYKHLEENVSKMIALKDYLIDGLLNIDGVTVNSKKGNEGAPHIVSASFSGVRSEVLLHALEDKGVYISAGSACSSNKPAISETLKAMNIDKDLLGSTVRFSFSRFNTKEEIDYTLEQLKAMLPILRKYVRR